jgi:cyclophilin family peptidyl-prolyl cis-trans isomerase
MRTLRSVFALLLLTLLPGLLWAANPKVELTTSLGKIELELYPEKAPKSVENFLRYVNDGHYNGTVFHRIISGFMVQGGGFDKAMVERSTRAPIANEANNGLKNEPGTLAMARTMDPHSATAQFFINVGNNGFLNHRAANVQGWGYAVFGRVTQGMDVVERMSRVRTTNRGMYQDVPMEAVVIEKAVVKAE